MYLLLVSYEMGWYLGEQQVWQLGEVSTAGAFDLYLGHHEVPEEG